MKKIVYMLLTFASCMILCTGCGKREKVQSEKTDQIVEIPMTLIVDSSTGKKNEEDVVSAFNLAYEGKYHLNVTWKMETEEDYRKNLKRMNVTDSLPSIITDIRMLPSFYQMMIKDGRIENLAPYIEKDTEWKNMIEPYVLQSCSEKDGAVYLAPLSTAAFSCSGIFYNKSLFQKAGIKEFPKTWDEFWKCCEQLKRHGITPLALHTEGTGWAPMLLATAKAADTKEGAEFMQQLYPSTYQNQVGLDIANTLKKLMSYTSKDAIHSDFDVAYNDFFSGKAAMIPNGYWMIDQIPYAWKQKTRFAAFPGNKLICSPETFGWSIVTGYSEDVKKGAVTFLKFRTKQNKEKKEELFHSDLTLQPLALKDYINVYENNLQFVPNYQVKWNSVLQEETIGEYLPELATGKITPEEFVERENDSIKQFENEK